MRERERARESHATRQESLRDPESAAGAVEKVEVALEIPFGYSSLHFHLQFRMEKAQLAERATVHTKSRR